MNKDEEFEIDFEEYADLFLKHVPSSEMVDSATYRGRCVVCGDSKRDEYKKRLYLLKEAGKYPALVKCHNCGYKNSASNFFNRISPEELKNKKQSWKDRDLSDLKKLSLLSNREKREDKTKRYDPDSYLKRFDDELIKAKRSLTNFFQNYTYSILHNSEALLYIQNRNVLDNYISEMRLLKPEFHNAETFRYSYFKNYILIPFLDSNDNLPYYFHSRKYKNLDAKSASYLSCPYRSEDPEISFFLNECRVHSDEPILIAEGTIDSLNLENSIAVNGIHKINNEQIKKFEYRYGKNIIYTLDNELIDNEARKKTKELLKKGKNVFLWGELAKDLPIASKIKDFNQLACVSKRKVIPTNTILKYVRNNISAMI